MRQRVAAKGIAAWALIGLGSACQAPPELAEVIVRVDSDIDSFEPFVLDDGWTVDVDVAYGGLTDIVVADVATGEPVETVSQVALGTYSDGGTNVLFRTDAAIGSRLSLSFRTVSVEGSSLGIMFDDALEESMIAGNEVLRVQGQAYSPGKSTRVDFSLGFEVPRSYSACGSQSAGTVVLEDDTELTLFLHAAELFQAGASGGESQFGVFAAADFDGDGTLNRRDLEIADAVDAGLVDAADVPEGAPNPSLYDVMAGWAVDAVRVEELGACRAEETAE